MHTILLADDDCELLEMYELWLDRDDWTVRTATDGDEALSALDETIEVAVLDRQMPTMAGDEVAREISSSYPECDVIIASAFQPDDSIDEATYDEYVTKPLHMDDLVDAVESQLNGPVATEC